MRWRKLGCVYAANGERDWAQTHAYIPTPLVLDDDRIRIYVAFLDRVHVGRVGFVDVDARDPLRILTVSREPVLGVGEPGTFDDSGVTPISVIRYGERLLMYYVGWQKGCNVRYFLFTGLAVGENNGVTFNRHSKVPLLDRCDDELFVRSAAHVIRDGNIYRMWYVGGTEWLDIRGKQIPTYNLRYMESEDPFRWVGKSRLLVECKGDDEFGFGRPFVVRERGIYKMWYSIRTRSKGYRIGYAESADGVEWERKDKAAGIDVSESGWDSEMVCFASVVDCHGVKFLFYNGNNYGETGFGVALLEE